MAFVDHRIAADDFVGKDIAGLPVEPSVAGITAAQLQAQFDAAVKSVVVPAFNGLIDELSTESGGASISVPPLSETSGDTIGEQLAWLLGQLQGVVLDNVPDGSISDIKLSDGGIKLTLDQHLSDFARHVIYCGVTTNFASNDYTLGIPFEESPAVYVFQASATNTAASPRIIDGDGVVITVYPSGYAALDAGQIASGGVYFFWYAGTGAGPTARTQCILMNPEMHSHTHTLAQIGPNGASDANHTHAPASIGAAAASHTQAVSTITGLQAALDGKSATSHTHTTLASLQIAGARAANSAGVVNVVYNNTAAPSASGMTDGTIYIKYS